MHHLTIDLSDDADGVATLEALASTQAARHPAVMAEVREIQAWARRQFPNGPGPLDEGADWDEDLQVSEEPGGWVSVSLTLSVRPPLMPEFAAAFAQALE